MRRAILLLGSIFISLGCGSSSTSNPNPQPDCANKVGSACVGVPTSAICNDASCTDGVTCSSIVKVAGGAELTAAASTASAGTCIALAKGTYDPVTIAGGVSLLGPGASSVNVQGVIVKAGSGTTLRGISITVGGLTAQGTTGLVVDRVDLHDGTGYGAWLVDSEAKITTSTIENNKGYGFVAQCKTTCSPKPKLALDHVFATGNEAVGLMLTGVDATMDSVLVTKSQVRSFSFGRGIEVDDSTLVAKSVVVDGNKEIGVFASGGDVKLGPDLVVRGNLRGVQLQSVTSATLSGFQITGNAAVGLGCDGAKGVVIQGGLVADTASATMPVDQGGMQAVGDGLNWLHGSELTVDASVQFKGSSRRPVITDDTAKGSFSGSLSGGDEALGVVIQGGTTATIPDGLSVGAGLKVDRLSSKDALPLALAAAASKAPGN